jgi:cyanophycinase-like exopeptidase
VRHTLPRLLVLIGSGELAAQMTRGHRMIAQRLAGEHGRIGDVKAAIVDTPFGFQANADALSDTLVDHFARRVGLSASLASMRRADIDPVAREGAYATIRDASFVFSGPGSPSYAVRTWSESEIPDLFADKLCGGGALVLASAAALAVGRFTVPVYEIYKAGADPHWLAGLDVLSVLGISAAVLPHWDNAEGPGHDTRYAFIGEERLLALERQLPDDVFILGIDEHTALLLDIDAGSASVMGRGGVTVRRHGIEMVYPMGARYRLPAWHSRLRLLLPHLRHGRFPTLTIRPSWPVGCTRWRARWPTWTPGLPSRTVWSRRCSICARRPGGGATTPPRTPSATAWQRWASRSRTPRTVQSPASARRDGFPAAYLALRLAGRAASGHA